MSQYDEQLIAVINATEVEKYDVLKAISQHILIDDDGVVGDSESIEKTTNALIEVSKIFPEVLLVLTYEYYDCGVRYCKDVFMNGERHELFLQFNIPPSLNHLHPILQEKLAMV